GRHHLGIRGRLFLGIGGRDHFGIRGRIASEFAHIRGSDRGNRQHCYHPGRLRWSTLWCRARDRQTKATRQSKRLRNLLARSGQSIRLRGKALQRPRGCLKRRSNSIPVWRGPM
ncbi:hypothetical protein CN227_33515, partial [Sinorhizobium meliloti]